jgi:hypothetical protein
MRNLSVAVLALTVSACAMTPLSNAKLNDGDPARLNRDCRLLGSVTGQAFFGISDRARVDAAMADARDKAAAMGATDVYFVSADESTLLNTAQATARAFVCK